MKAIVQHAYGSPDLLELREIDRPVAGDHDVLVRVLATSVHADVWHTVTGQPFALRLMGAGIRRPKARVPGTDLAGVVESSGGSVSRFGPGDEVFGRTLGANLWRNGGTYAEYAIAPQDMLERKPVNLTFEQAAAVPTSGPIAVQGLRDEGRIRAGQGVLINGAGGSVGTFAVQLAKAWGANVTAVDRAEKLDTLRSLGADRVLDHTKIDFTRTGDRYDLIMDIPGDHRWVDLRRALTPEGTYVLIGHDQYGRAGRRWIGSLGRFAKLLVLSPFVRQLPGLRGARDPGDRLLVLKDLIEAGAIMPLVDRTFPLEGVPDAILYLAQGHARGTVVISVG